jgi:phospholipase/carboxylesterase
LGLRTERDGLLYVPEGYDPQVANPLMVLLHGAGGAADNWVGFYTMAEENGLVLLMPESRYSTWDRVWGEFGIDVRFIDRALAHTFDRCNIDPQRIALGGFSDGASYGLSLGLSNGDLFSHLMGFSPGFLMDESPIVGKPRIFISHGSEDAVLPVSNSRDNIVPNLRGRGYDVHYLEFEGGHRVGTAVARAAVEWFLG